MDLHDVLTPSAIEVCHLLAESGLLEPFYLAGGTGLALQLGHRKSDELDFFLKDPRGAVPANAIANRIERLFGESDVMVEMKEASQVTWRIRGTKLSFTGYPFPLLYALTDAGVILPELRGISLASAGEIATMKAYALGRRATARDYVDLYFVLSSGTAEIDSIIKGAERKLIIEGDPVFSPKLFLEQLCYTKDLEDVDVTLRSSANQGSLWILWKRFFADR